MTDQMFAMGTQHDVTSGERRHRHYRLLGIGLTLYAVWQASVIAGAVAGAQVPAAWSLDFVVTLTFLVLLVPALRTRADLAAAVVAGAVALLAPDCRTSSPSSWPPSSASARVRRGMAAPR